METFTFVDASNKSKWSRQKEKENMLTECIFLSDNSRNLNIEARALFNFTNGGGGGVMCTLLLSVIEAQLHIHLDE